MVKENLRRLPVLALAKTEAFAYLIALLAKSKVGADSCKKRKKQVAATLDTGLRYVMRYSITSKRSCTQRAGKA